MKITSIFIRKKHDKYCVIAKFLDKDKKIKQKQLKSFDKKKAATIYLTEEKNKLNKNIFVLPSDTTLISYLNSWNELRKDNIEIKTYIYYRDLSVRVNSYFENTKLTSLTSIQIELFYKELSKELSKNSVLKYHRFLNKALGDAKRKRLIEFNPCEFVEIPRGEKSDVAQSLNLEESQELLNLSIATRYELPVHLGIFLGLRASEMLGLSWDRINFKNRTIKIDRSTIRNKETKKVEFKPPKTKKSIRTIRIPNELMKCLELNYKRFRYLKLQGVPNPHNLLFTKLNGDPMSSDTFSNIFSSFLKKINFKHIRYHDLRHTNATLHLKAGTSLKVTSNHLGHSTINITADLYTHVLQELENEAADNLDNLFANTK